MTISRFPIVLLYHLMLELLIDQVFQSVTLHTKIKKYKIDFLFIFLIERLQIHSCLQNIKFTQIKGN